MQPAVRIIEQDESVLVSAASNGDKRAFQQLYKSHVGRVYALCLRLTAEPGSAEEACQDVFIKVWNKLPQFRRDCQFSTWLHSISVRTAISHIRARRSWIARFVSQPDTEFEDLQGSEEMDTTNLDQLIARLPPRSRAVFVLHALEGLRHKDIAQHLNIAENSSKAHYHRARNALNNWLSE